MLHKDKRGVSIMIGYVLLIVIAIALAILVYFFLMSQVPKDEPECLGDVSISIEHVDCLSDTQRVRLELTLKNRGLFNIDGAFIRAGFENRVARELISERHNHQFINDPNGDGKLNPDENWNISYEGGIGFFTGQRWLEIDIEPFIYVDDKIAVCEKAIVKDRVYCST